MAAIRRDSEKRISVDLVILELWDDYHHRWFELYESLGLKRDKLEHLSDVHGKQPSVCMHEATRLWFEQGDPKPSWERLAHAMRYKLLDPDRADKIEAMISNLPNPLVGQTIGGDRTHVTEEEIIDIFGERDTPPFGYLLTQVLDEFFTNPSPYTLAFHINTLCSPNGTKMISPDLIRYSKSIDGVLIPLVLHSYFSHYDIDFLIYLINTFNKKDSLMPHVKRFIEKRTLGEPRVRKIRNLHQNFMVRCVYGADHPSINWRTIKEVKEKLREVFELTDFPYLLYFIGWSVNPLSLCYQLPLACISDFGVILAHRYPGALIEAKIAKVIMEVGSAQFHYEPVNKPSY